MHNDISESVESLLVTLPAVERFTGRLEDSGRGGGRWVEVPFDPREVFGEARPPVAGTVNGTPFRSRLAVYGGKAYLGLTKELRAAAGIELGDAVEVALERDDAPRELELPGALVAVFERSPQAADAFAALSFTHRREYVTWIAEAKQSETRDRRAAKAVEMLLAGVKHP
jgi:hypothetical protein